MDLKLNDIGAFIPIMNHRYKFKISDGLIDICSKVFQGWVKTRVKTVEVKPTYRFG
jgi:hypothetical protein